MIKRSILFLIITVSWSNVLGQTFIFKCPITNLLKFLNLNLLNNEGVSHGSSTLPEHILHFLLETKRLLAENMKLYQNQTPKQ